MPTSSARVAAPTGKPNDFVSLSSSLGSTPSYKNEDIKNKEFCVEYIKSTCLIVQISSPKNVVFLLL